MFYLSDEERQYLLKGLIPKSRDIPVNSELRGWNWHQPPLAPPYDRRVALYEVAGRYCRTGRDLYLRRIMHERLDPTPEMVEGRVLHAAAVSVFTRAKKLIYTLGVSRYLEIFHDLLEVDYSCMSDPPDSIDVEALTDRVRRLWDYEYRNITARIQAILSRQPRIGDDSLAFQAVPVVLEQRLDGGFLGLSHHLSADAFIFSEPMILELKFGPALDFYRLYTTGYALVLESLTEYPVNLGCLIYPRYLPDGRILVEKDFHIVDDELRQWFIEERDEKMRMLTDEVDPGKPDICYEKCTFLKTCWGDVRPKVGPLLRK